MTRVAVLYGGISAEREVSLNSGRQVIDALREAGFEVTPIVVEDDLAWTVGVLKGHDRRAGRRGAVN